VLSDAKTDGLSFQGISSYDDFMNAIKSPATKKGYENSIKRYLNHIKKNQMEDLLEYKENPRYIESQVIDYHRILQPGFDCTRDQVERTQPQQPHSATERGANG
jgi:hypothetical protein